MSDQIATIAHPDGSTFFELQAKRPDYGDWRGRRTFPYDRGKKGAEDAARQAAGDAAFAWFSSGVEPQTAFRVGDSRVPRTRR